MIQSIPSPTSTESGHGYLGAYLNLNNIQSTTNGVAALNTVPMNVQILPPDAGQNDLYVATTKPYASCIEWQTAFWINAGSDPSTTAQTIRVYDNCDNTYPVAFPIDAAWLAAYAYDYLGDGVLRYYGEGLEDTTWGDGIALYNVQTRAWDMLFWRPYEEVSGGFWNGWVMYEMWWSGNACPNVMAESRNIQETFDGTTWAAPAFPANQPLAATGTCADALTIAPLVVNPDGSHTADWRVTPQ